MTYSGFPLDDSEKMAAGPVEAGDRSVLIVRISGRETHGPDKEVKP